MKTTIAKYIALIAAASIAFPAIAGEVVVKPSRYSPPAKAQFETSKPAPRVVAACCKEKYTTVTTQDSKLKTKQILVANHGCAACKTSIKSVGGQKAGRRDVVEHTCAGKLTTVADCCTNMPGMK